MAVIWTLLCGWALSASVMLALWAWHLRIRNVGVVDLGWVSSVMLLALFDAATGAGHRPRRWWLAAMVLIWGGRLAAYLLRDRILGRPEDQRYVDLRRRGSYVAALSFFAFFQAQALLAVIFSLPALVAAANPAPRLAPIEIAGAVLWLAALIGEALADRQLELFKRKPASRGRACRDGLWRYSRHPNYFFEWLIWVGYAVFAIGSPWGSVAFACPALMLYLLFRVTGVPATEAQALRSKGDDYRRYQQDTSVFVPWFPRSAS